MDTFNTLKRRTTERLQSLPQSLHKNIPNVNMPSMPAIPSLGRGKGTKGHSTDTLKATWERIQLPPLPRSSHTIDVVAGTAYIFGGEVRPRQPVDNDMHAVVLPSGFANPDCYAIKARPAVEPVEHAPQEEGVAGGSSSAYSADRKEKGLTDIPLGDGPSVPTIREPSPAGRAPPPPEGDPEEGEAARGGEGPATTSPRPDKGKGTAGPEPPADAVPPPRVGHASAVIGSRILVFGGRGGPDLKTPLEERGRVWAFDTRTHTWAALDPRPAALPAPLTLSSAAKPTYPTARSYHCCAATDRPGQPGSGGGGGGAAGKGGAGRRARASNWREWAEGDRAEVGIPQAPVVGNIAARATDEESEGYGTFFVHGGCLADGSRGTDLWAFDVRTRVWQQLPDAPGPGRGGSAVCISKSRLYRFGGFNGQSQEGGRIDYLELGLDTFDDVSALGDEVNVTARGGWKTLAAEAPGVTVAGGGGGGGGEGEEADGGAAASSRPLVEQSPWPGARSVHGFRAVTTGGGREYLLLLLGEREPSGAGHEAAGQFWDDVWAFQVPSLGMSVASVTDAILAAFKRKTGEGRWYRVETAALDEDDPAAAEGPGPRGWIATSVDPEDNAVVIWGGLNSSNKRLGDGWILRLS